MNLRKAAAAALKTTVARPVLLPVRRLRGRRLISIRRLRWWIELIDTCPIKVAEHLALSNPRDVYCGISYFKYWANHFVGYCFFPWTVLLVVFGSEIPTIVHN